jgi:hypothetical protein
MSGLEVKRSGIESINYEDEDGDEFSVDPLDGKFAFTCKNNGREQVVYVKFSDAIGLAAALMEFAKEQSK